MKRKTTIITEEFDENGKVKSKITETIEEEDNGYIYPQYPTYPTYPTYPWWPSTTGNPIVTYNSNVDTR